MRTTLLAVAALTFAACGGPGSFNGTVSGESLAVKSSVFLVGKDVFGNPTATVFMGDISSGCDELKANRVPKSGTYVDFALYTDDSNHKYSTPDVGSYTVVDPGSFSTVSMTGDLAISTFTKNDTNCSNSLQSKNANSKSGLIKVTTFKGETGGSIGGTFDVTYGDQNDHVTGSFNADFCDAPLPNNPNCE